MNFGIKVVLDDLLGHTSFMINMPLLNFSIHRKFYQNRFLNKYARKKKAKIPWFQSLRVFFVRCRRTYVLKKMFNTEKSCSVLEFLAFL